MRTLQVFLFGTVRVRFRGEERDLNLTRVVQNLLAYLILQRNRLLPRETIAGTLWRDYSQEKARNCLNTTLWRLRRAIEPEGVQAGSYLITSRTGEIGFNSNSPFYLDVAEMDAAVQSCLPLPIQSISPDQIECLEQALNLYQGELLDGNYDDWVLMSREHQQKLYLDGNKLLKCVYHDQNQIEKCLACCLRILAVDPLREDIHRDLMELYTASGQRALALHQFETMRDYLKDELGVEPMEETYNIYHRIKNLPPGNDSQSRLPAAQFNNNPGYPSPADLPERNLIQPGSPEFAELCKALNDMQRFSQSLEEGQRELRRAILALQQMITSNR